MPKHTTKKLTLASKRINSVLPNDAAGAINVLCEEFEESKNPLYLMSAFIRCVNAGICPPVPILQAVAKAFWEVIYGTGTKGGRRKTLDQALSLQPIGRGKQPVFAAQEKEIETYTVALMIWQLTVGPEKVSEEDAAARVSLFLENRSPRVIPRLANHGPDYLRDEYSRTWKKRFHLDAIEPASRLHPASWTPTQLAWFRTDFPSPKISSRSKRS